MNRLVAGTLKIDLSPIDVGPTLRASIQGLQPAAEAKGVRVTLMDGAFGTVLADSRRLQQVFWNLLHNAIKFTPHGGRVHVSVVRGAGAVQIAVEDSGRGISREFLPHVFERFRQEDSSTTRESQGLGLGLSISRHLVELHGGSVTASSPGVGQGATFTVELPAAEGVIQSAGNQLAEPQQT